MDNHVLGPATYPATTATDKKQPNKGGAAAPKDKQRWGPLKQFGRPSELTTTGNKQLMRAMTISPDKRTINNATKR